VQGLGEGPDRVLTGTTDGYICLLEREGHTLPPVDLPWALGKRAYGGVPVDCLAATDEFVIAGLRNGAMRLLKLKVVEP
jgi:hypothetical protein